MKKTYFFLFCLTLSENTQKPEAAKTFCVMDALFPFIWGVSHLAGVSNLAGAAGSAWELCAPAEGQSSSAGVRKQGSMGAGGKGISSELLGKSG